MNTDDLVEKKQTVSSIFSDVAKAVVAMPDWLLRDPDVESVVPVEQLDQLNDGQFVFVRNVGEIVAQGAYEVCLPIDSGCMGGVSTTVVHALVQQPSADEIADHPRL
jgi:hypothetical protein